MIDLNEFARKALDIAEIRQKNGALIKTDARSILKHCATEVVEAAESGLELAMYKSQWDDEEWLKKPRQRFASELADIICCALIAAAKEGIDIEEALKEVQEKNRKRAEGTGDKL